MKSDINHKHGYDDSTVCLVCGFRFFDGLSLIEWSQRACRCCGADIGYTYDIEDASGVKEFRKYWENSQYVFFDEDLKPKGWNKEMALKQIKDNVPEELQ